MMESTHADYVIVGAGIAGISAAEAIREIDPRGSLLLLNGESAPPYCRPLIIEVLEGKRAFDDILLRPPEWFAENRLELLTGDPVTGFDAGERRLTLSSGRCVSWNKLLIATGSVPARPVIEGLDSIPTFTLYRQEDVAGLKSACRPGASALLLGTGLIGLQAMTALKHLGVSVVAVELMPKVLPMILDLRAARYAQAKLEENGIAVHTGTTLTELRAASRAGDRHVAVTKDGKEIPFDFLVQAVGMRPNLSLLENTGIECGRGVKVSPVMETSLTGIYAAGDITEYGNWIEERAEIHAHWVNAYRQGRIAGRHMAGVDSEPYEPVYLNSLSVFGLPVITMGASRIDETDAYAVHVTEAPARPSYARLVLKDGLLIAATFVNDVSQAGAFHGLMCNKIDIGDVAQSLLDQGPEGMAFLARLHAKTIEGEVDWPASMDLIDRFRKDHRHTRWGKEKTPVKQQG